ncbi:alpha/beta hydrolase [Nocardioides euryhalodurans]|uniref:Alpha/beta hydrolase n=1 Tax=Nocardioides euryhalodurans TaxID=2518370 RepID=A0A4P7GM79_9ACTN|nr:alpha/beta hydrolase [Nocardioides euryhalodurans]
MSPPSGTRTLRYGEDPSQLGELTLPGGTPRGVVVVVHGGFWKSAYDLSLGRPLAASLVEEGWAAWNLEYRRVGNGGGTPQTFDDVAAGIDRLAGVDGLDTSVVLTLGHSAGGHLATWAAGRRDARVPVTGVVSQAGVLDLVRADEQSLGGGAVAALLGHPAGPGDAAYDPAQQVPLDVPVRCVHGRDDDIVPLEQSQRYVDAATAAGADATLTEVDGDHFVVIDPGSDSWRVQLDLLDGLG